MHYTNPRFLVEGTGRSTEQCCKTRVETTNAYALPERLAVARHGQRELSVDIVVSIVHPTIQCCVLRVRETQQRLYAIRSGVGVVRVQTGEGVRSPVERKFWPIELVQGCSAFAFVPPSLHNAHTA